MSIKLSGSLSKALSEYSEEALDAMSDAVSVTALAVQGQAVKSIQRGEKSGVIYEKYKPRRTHQSSAPGQAPATDTGRLAGSITSAMISRRVAEVGTLLPYGIYLEYGTRIIAPRPWLSPAMQFEKKRFLKLIESALKA